MDISPFDDSPSVNILPYDDPLPTEDTTSTFSNNLASSDGTRSLADRIGNTKVYLLSEALKSRGGKRRRDEVDDGPDDVDMDEGESPLRENAILLHGTPISHLPTSNIFAYATHFDAHPLGLEWIDDTTCILVFDSKADARTAYRYIQKSPAEEPSLDDESVTAKPIPVAIWPAEDRINATLGQGEGLKGILRMRWARVEDVKKRGAKNESEFYRKYGRDAGKTFEEGPPPMKRRRPGTPVSNPISEAEEKAKLDAELDKFLAEDEDTPVTPQPSPPSRMRSDYIGKDGRTLLDRTSLIRAHPHTLASRLTSAADVPRRTRSSGVGGERAWDEGKGDVYDTLTEPRSRRGGGGSRDRRERRRKRSPRPTVTQADLDAELDAFLNAKD